MEKLNDAWFRWLGLPMLVLLANLFYLDDYHYDPLVYLAWGGMALAYTVPVWMVSVWWLLQMRRRYRGIGQTRRRVLLTGAGYLTITVIGQSCFVALVDVLSLAAKPVSFHSYLLSISIGFAVSGIVGAVYEVIYYLHLYRQAVAEKESVQQVRLQSQFDHLKTQVNPHFLFNSLNALSALIPENPRQANVFLDELATVYRYLLQSHQQGVVPLRTEADFIGSFLHLLKMRFGAALAYRIEVEQGLLDHLLPPLVLQILVENAVKHNVAEAAHPLEITLRTTDGFLVVANTLRRKRRVFDVQPGGLGNLTARFQAAGLPPPRIVDDDGSQFSVWLPLMPKVPDNSVSSTGSPLPNPQPS